MPHRLIQIYTGNGKGKTTAALGLALRAAGNGLKTFIGQFIKKGNYGEIRALRCLRLKITVRQYGSGCFIKGKPTSQDIKYAQKGLCDLVMVMKSGKYDVVIADEIFCAVTAGLISAREVLSLINKKPSRVELVLTGRNAPQSIIKRADLITEMRRIKHPYDKGIHCRKGIEF
jgi:cob(I)alamin adenosyltransferase